MVTSPLGDLQVHTPSGQFAEEKSDAPSPLTQIRNEKQALDCVRMFLQGCYDELARSLSEEERRSVSPMLSEEHTLMQISIISN